MAGNVEHQHDGESQRPARILLFFLGGDLPPGYNLVQVESYSATFIDVWCFVDLFFIVAHGSIAHQCLFFFVSYGLTIEDMWGVSV